MTHNITDSTLKIHLTNFLSSALIIMFVFTVKTFLKIFLIVGIMQDLIKIKIEQSFQLLLQLFWF